jgi:heme/copper-type cytochrome/quinol oxidase subunit 1
VSLVWPVAAGLVLALALGGRLQRLARLRWRGLWLFYVALAVRIVAFPFAFLPWRTPEGTAKVLYLASYAILVVAVALNFRIPGVAVVATGMALNVLAISVNEGHMPALPSALRGAGLHFTRSRNSEVFAHPRLPWLIDRWAVPSWIPWGSIFSVGDVIVAVGAVCFALLATGALDRFRPRRGRGTAVAPAA